MKWKQRLEVQVPAKKDVFTVAEKMLKVTGVLSSNVINHNSVVLSYDIRKIQPTQLLKLAA